MHTEWQVLLKQVIKSSFPTEAPAAYVLFEQRLVELVLSQVIGTDTFLIDNSGNTISDESGNLVLSGQGFSHVSS